MLNFERIFILTAPICPDVCVCVYSLYVSVSVYSLYVCVCVCIPFFTLHPLSLCPGHGPLESRCFFSNYPFFLLKRTLRLREQDLIFLFSVSSQMTFPRETLFAGMLTAGMRMRITWKRQRPSGGRSALNGNNGFENR